MNDKIDLLISEVSSICKDLYDNNYSTQLLTLGLDEMVLFYETKDINLLMYGIIGYNIRYRIKDEVDYVKVSNTSKFSYSVLYERLINLYVCLDFNPSLFDYCSPVYCEHSILDKVIYSNKIQYPNNLLYLDSKNYYQGDFSNVNMQNVILKVFYNSFNDNTLDYHRFVNLGFFQLKMLECDISNFDYNIILYSDFFSNMFNNRFGLLRPSSYECNIKIYCDEYFYSWFKGWVIAFFPGLFMCVESKQNEYILYCCI